MRAGGNSELGRPSRLRQSPAVQNIVLWIYIVLLVVGGVIGFFKGEKQSLALHVLWFCGDLGPLRGAQFF